MKFIDSDPHRPSTDSTTPYHISITPDPLPELMLVIGTVKPQLEKMGNLFDAIGIDQQYFKYAHYDKPYTADSIIREMRVDQVTGVIACLNDLENEKAFLNALEAIALQFPVAIVLDHDILTDAVQQLSDWGTVRGGYLELFSDQVIGEFISYLHTHLHDYVM